MLKIFSKFFSKSSISHQSEKKSYYPQQTQSFHGWLESIGRMDMAKSLATLYYLKCYPVNAGVGEISDRLKNIKPVYLDEDGEVVKNNVTEFLKRPNPTDALGDILNKININYKTTGEMYLMKIGITKILEIQVLPSVKVQVNGMNQNKPDAFIYSDGDVSVTFSKREDGHFWDNTGTRELCYYHEYNPSNSIGGLSPLSAISLEIEQYMSAGNHNLSMLTNSIKPSVILSSKSEDMPSPEQVGQFKELLDEFYRGSANSGNYLITGNFDVSPVSVKSDMDYKDLTNSTRNAILQKLGVPLTIADTTASTYNNRQLDQLAFYDDTVIPLFRMYILWLVGSIQDDASGHNRIVDISIDETHIPALADRALVKLERRAKIGYLSINEIRRIDGYEEVEGGEMIYRPSNDTPIGGVVVTDEDLEEAKQWIR